MADDSEGVLFLQPTGRWAVCRSGRPPAEITSGELFRVDVDGELRPTRMEFRHSPGRSRAASSGVRPANTFRLTTIPYAMACAPRSSYRTLARLG
jgi:hypothetical protein